MGSHWRAQTKEDVPRGDKKDTDKFIEDFKNFMKGE